MRGLAARGHSIEVYRLGEAHEDGTSEHAYGFSTHVLPFHPSRHRRGAAYLDDLRTYRDRRRVGVLEAELSGALQRGRYDVVLASVLRWGTAPSLLKSCPLPTVYYCHEVPRRFQEPWCQPAAGPLSLFERGRLLWRWPAQQFIDHYDQRSDIEAVRAATTVLVNSRYTQQKVREYYGRDARVCYLGVNTHTFTPRAPGGDPPAGVISVGSLEPHKGFDFIIEALSTLPPDSRPVLTIVGSGGHPSMPAHLMALAKKRGVALTLRRGLTDLDLAALYRASRAFVFGALWEPFGLVVLEAMAAGLPVVAVAEGGLPEIVRNGETGYLCDRDPHKFGQRLKALLDSPERSAAMGAAGRAVSLESWQWDTTIENLEQHLAGVVGRAV